MTSRNKYSSHSCRRAPFWSGAAQNEKKNIPAGSSLLPKTSGKDFLSAARLSSGMASKMGMSDEMTRLSSTYANESTTDFRVFVWIGAWNSKGILRKSKNIPIRTNLDRRSTFFFRKNLLSTYLAQIINQQDQQRLPLHSNIRPDVHQ